MVRFWIFLGVAIVVFWVYSILDCLLTERASTRLFSKWIWLLIVVFFPLAGGFLWFFFGRPRANPLGKFQKTLAPDDDPEFLAKLKEDFFGGHKDTPSPDEPEDPFLPGKESL